MSGGMGGMAQGNMGCPHATFMGMKKMSTKRARTLCLLKRVLSEFFIVFSLFLDTRGVQRGFGFTPIDLSFD